MADIVAKVVIKNSPGCRRDFRVKMWGISSPDDKLTGDLGSVIEATQIGGRRPDRLMAGKLSPGNFGLLQQYLPKADSCSARKTRYGNCLIGNWLATWQLKAERAASFHKWLSRICGSPAEQGSHS